MDIDIEKLEKAVLDYLPNRCGRQFAERIRSGEFNAKISEYCEVLTNFDRFWNAYPLKKDKEYAKKA